jgi:hypothetical protein
MKLTSMISPSSASVSEETLFEQVGEEIAITATSQSIWRTPFGLSMFLNQSSLK